MTCPGICRRNVLHLVTTKARRSIDFQFRASILDLEAAGLDGLARKTAVLACHDPVSARKFVGVNPPIVRVCPGHQPGIVALRAPDRKRATLTRLHLLFTYFFVGRFKPMDTITTAWARAASSNTAPLPAWSPFKCLGHLENSPSKCGTCCRRNNKALIRAVEATGAYSPALVNNGRNKVLDKTTRDSSRCMVSHPTLANVLFQRAVVPIAQALATRKRPTEVNELLRFLKYERGQRFDHTTTIPTSTAESPKGRGTLALHDPPVPDRGLRRGLHAILLRWYGTGRTYDVLPETGMAIVHEHDILHAERWCCLGQSSAFMT